jgi:hypothetical protein
MSGAGGEIRRTRRNRPAIGPTARAGRDTTRGRCSPRYAARKALTVFRAEQRLDPQRLQAERAPLPLPEHVEKTLRIGRASSA